MILDKLLDGEIKKNQLLDIYEQNKQLKNDRFIFYTDGSLIREESTLKQKMGMSWI